MADKVEADESLRRYIRGNECQEASKGVWVVHKGLFYQEGGLSFSMRPPEWADEDVDRYRRAYATLYKIPGVVQIAAALFARASMDIPWLEDDPTDTTSFAALHCAWPCPSEAGAEHIADLVTAAMAGNGGARLVFKKEQIK